MRNAEEPHADSSRQAKPLGNLEPPRSLPQSGAHALSYPASSLSDSPALYSWAMRLTGGCVASEAPSRVTAESVSSAEQAVFDQGLAVGNSDPVELQV